MFWHIYFYTIKNIFRNKTAVIWTLIFPIALSTFMFMAFGEIYDTDELMSVIPVAVVVEEKNEGLEKLLETLSQEGEDQFFSVRQMEEKEALAALNNDEIDGVIYEGTDITLTVNDNSFVATIIKTVIEQYVQSESIIKDMAVNGATQAELKSALEALLNDHTYFTEGKTSDGCQNVYNNYFYAIFAMSCLFASFVSVERISNMQANTSSLGIRRAIVPAGKMVMVCSEFLAMLTIQFLVECAALIYMNILGVDFGSKYPAMLLILFIGSSVGLAIGAIIGAVAKFTIGTKIGICVSVSMALSVMADLVAGGVKDAIEHTVPIVNRINPAALISDAFYALNIYDSYNRYIADIAALSVISLILITVSILILRRNTYASL